MQQEYVGSAIDRARSLVADAISALRQGNNTQARVLVESALQADPNSEAAWLWLSGLCQMADERRMCLERVLAINPMNQVAMMALKKLDTSEASGVGTTTSGATQASRAGSPHSGTFAQRLATRSAPNHAQTRPFLTPIAFNPTETSADVVTPVERKTPAASSWRRLFSNGTRRPAQQV